MIVIKDELKTLRAPVSSPSAVNAASAPISAWSVPSLVSKVPGLADGFLFGPVHDAGRSPFAGMRLAGMLGAASTAGEGAGAIELPAAGARILVVDDNVDSADSMAMLLSLDGHHVQVAFDGPTALSAAAEFRPQAVLLDIGLPGMDGYEVARRLRERPENRSVLLVAITGYGQDDDRLRAKEAGFDHHLVKPVDPDVLTQVLEILTRN